MVDLPLLPNALPVVAATLNGKPVAILIDTGGATSAVSRSAAADLALSPTGRSMIVGGVGGEEVAPVVTARSGACRSWASSGPTSCRTITSTATCRFAVGDPEIAKTLLGADFMRFNHIWISYSHRTLFIQPNLENPIVHLVAASPGDVPAR